MPSLQVAEELAAVEEMELAQAVEEMELELAQAVEEMEMELELAQVVEETELVPVQAESVQVVSDIQLWIR